MKFYNIECDAKNHRLKWPVVSINSFRIIRDSLAGVAFPCISFDP